MLHRRARVSRYPLVAEAAAGLALAVVAARATSGWELAALAWLVLVAIPLPSSTWPCTGSRTRPPPLPSLHER